MSNINQVNRVRSSSDVGAPNTSQNGNVSSDNKKSSPTGKKQSLQKASKIVNYENLNLEEIKKRGGSISTREISLYYDSSSLTSSEGDCLTTENPLHALILTTKQWETLEAYTKRLKDLGSSAEKKKETSPKKEKHEVQELTRDRSYTDIKSELENSSEYLSQPRIIKLLEIIKLNYTLIKESKQLKAIKEKIVPNENFFEICKLPFGNKKELSIIESVIFNKMDKGSSFFKENAKSIEVILKRIAMFDFSPFAELYPANNELTPGAMEASLKAVCQEFLRKLMWIAYGIEGHEHCMMFIKAFTISPHSCAFIIESILGPEIAKVRASHPIYKGGKYNEALFDEKKVPHEMQAMIAIFALHFFDKLRFESTIHNLIRFDSRRQKLVIEEFTSTRDELKEEHRASAQMAWFTLKEVYRNSISAPLSYGMFTQELEAKEGNAYNHTISTEDDCVSVFDALENGQCPGFLQGIFSTITNEEIQKALKEAAERRKNQN